MADGSLSVLKVYPNPAMDFILLQLSDNLQVKSVGIYDLTGRKMKEEKLFSYRQSTAYCSVKELPAGQYIIRVTEAGGKVFSGSFMKHK